MTVEAKQQAELVKNVAGRKVPSFVNGRVQVAFQGVGKHKPEGRKAAAPVRSNAEFPKNGD
jgi:citrate lyase subunit alpha/citrate CoA-transferase